jgi:hypothetical protein
VASLTKTQGRFYKKTVQAQSVNWPQNLIKAGRKLQNFSEAISLLRPLKAFETTKELFLLLKDVHNESMLWAKPFAEVLREFRRRDNTP